MSNLLRSLHTKEQVVNWAFNGLEFKVEDAKWIFEEKGIKYKLTFKRTKDSIKIEIKVF